MSHYAYDDNDDNDVVGALDNKAVDQESRRAAGPSLERLVLSVADRNGHKQQHNSIDGASDDFGGGPSAHNDDDVDRLLVQNKHRSFRKGLAVGGVAKRRNEPLHDLDLDDPERESRLNELHEAKRQILELERKIQELEGRIPRKYPDVTFLNYKNRKRILSKHCTCVDCDNCDNSENG
uniref:Uncharacterized protein n=1 Tax=Anopheles maculatus TaxID=74869 RepID=A0A182SDJ7_9DIPT